MKHEIDIFSEIVDRIRDVYDITSFTLVGNTYTFVTESLGSMLVNDYITILGNDYIVVSTNQATYEFSVISDIDISAADFWKAKKPYFDYEKVLVEANILLDYLFFQVRCLLHPKLFRNRNKVSLLSKNRQQKYQYQK